MDGGDGSGRDCRHGRSRHGYRDGLGAGRCLGGRSAERHVSQKAWTGRNVNDDQFKQIAEFAFPYSNFERGDAMWVTLEVKPTNVPKKFILGVDFDPTQTKGVYVSHDSDGSGRSLTGLPGERFQDFRQGDWLIRAKVLPDK
jgi:hypothetical protein